MGIRAKPRQLSETYRGSRQTTSETGKDMPPGVSKLYLNVDLLRSPMPYKL